MMDKPFTDLLDEYLTAKRAYDESRDADDARYHVAEACEQRYEKARGELNAHMDLVARLGELGVIDLGAA